MLLSSVQARFLWPFVVIYTYIIQYVIYFASCRKLVQANLIFLFFAQKKEELLPSLIQITLIFNFCFIFHSKCTQWPLFFANSANLVLKSSSKSSQTAQILVFRCHSQILPWHKNKIFII